MNKLAIPLMKRCYPPLIANKIVSVQPMLGPAGLVHYLRYRYKKSQEDVVVPIKPPKFRSIDDSWEGM